MGRIKGRLQNLALSSDVQILLEVWNRAAIFLERIPNKVRRCVTNLGVAAVHLEDHVQDESQASFSVTADCELETCLAYRQGDNWNSEEGNTCPYSQISRWNVPSIARFRRSGFQRRLYAMRMDSIHLIIMLITADHIDISETKMWKRSHTGGLKMILVFDQQLKEYGFGKITR